MFLLRRRLDMEKNCPICNQPQVLKENPTASAEDLAYGSNYAGMMIPEHEFEGKKCEGSNIELR
jgi:hypothetical protein